MHPFQSVFKSKAFQELSEDALGEVLKDSGLNMDESEILKYIKEWAAVNSVSKIQVLVYKENFGIQGKFWYTREILVYKLIRKVRK